MLSVCSACAVGVVSTIHAVPLLFKAFLPEDMRGLCKRSSAVTVC